MIRINTAFLKQASPPASANTYEEHYLAEKASTRRLTWLDLVIAGGILSDLVLSLVDATMKWWYIGLVEVFLSLYLLSWLLARGIRPLLGRLLLAGFIAGVCELFTDASGQYVVHSLIYPTGALTLWTSPLYMPLSWMVVLTHLGYLAWRLRVVMGWRKASLLSAILGAIQIPIYEEMAYYGGWWRYKPVHLMLGHTPIYVLLFEGLIVAALPLLYDRIERRAWRQVALIGVIVGVWMAVAALVAWLVLGLW
ncbi:MAG TPA: hypothetical protein VII61_04555 [Ktedonobacteraceae bacterium]